MLTQTEIENSYLVVFKGTHAVSYTDSTLISKWSSIITYWQVVSTSLTILPIDFPDVLATAAGSHPSKVLIFTVDTLPGLLDKAATYRHYEPQDEVLAVMANWTKPIIERIEFMTDILTSRSGYEQRIKRRERPRVILEYDFLATERHLAYLQNQVGAIQGYRVFIPLWQYMKELKSLARLNEVEGLEAGKYLLYVGQRYYELVTIEKVNNLFYFQHDPQISMGYTAWLIPVELGSIREKVHFNLINPEVATGTIQANLDRYTLRNNGVVNGYALKNLPGTSKWVMTIEPNWISGLGVDYSRPVGLVDYGGKVVAYDLHGRSDKVFTCEFLCNAKDSAIRDFFISAQGRARDFYMPTFQNDLKPVGVVTVSSTEIKLIVEESGFSTYQYPQGFVNYLYITFHTKSAIIVKISGAGANVDSSGYPVAGAVNPAVASIKGGTEHILIETKEEIVISEIKTISFVTLTRFNSDSLEVNWITPEWYSVNTSFVSVIKR